MPESPTVSGCFRLNKQLASRKYDYIVLDHTISDNLTDGILFIRCFPTDKNLKKPQFFFPFGPNQPILLSKLKKPSTQPLSYRFDETSVFIKTFHEIIHHNCGNVKALCSSSVAPHYSSIHSKSENAYLVSIHITGDHVSGVTPLVFLLSWIVTI